MSEKLEKALIRMITRELQPISLVEDMSFGDFFKIMDPKYQIPSRHDCNTLLCQEFNNVQIVSVRWQVHNITTDLWMSLINSSFLFATSYFWNSKEERLDSKLLD